MQIFNVSIADKPLTKIPHFRGVFMRDTLPLHPFSVECGIVNFNTSIGSLGVLLLQQE